MVLFRW